MLLVTDLDGTFLKDDKTFNRPAFEKLLLAWRRAGHHFAIASGRELKWIERWFDDLLTEIDVVASNGAVLQRVGRSPIAVTIRPASYVALQELIDTYPEKPTELHGFSTQSMYLHQAYPAMHADSLAFAKQVYNLVLVDGFQQVKEPLTTITGHWSEVAAEEIIKKINQADLALYATTSGYGSVDILPAGVNKAVTLKQLLASNAMQTTDLIAVGDGMNDLEMLALAQQGYIMPQSDQRLFDYNFKAIDLDNNHDGVLALMAKLLTE
ncbi:sugar phosphatase [Weissella oryzae SG25]|uniref:Sugar phosphatase n=1 Tax=Weissella oryzae (strain DSM 25784 / JCM 18191 / LMG 30913 / SG25) TaxID=1329250 RepID=A0A069CZB6_WEIOS|nr:HAD family hydrolase [Weissella oryzae]GAK30411.1 sugar phosphatase [Weissella oryzae SG25]